MTSAARRFLQDIRISWDSSDPWEQTATLGLSDEDGSTLRLFCEESGEDFEAAAAEVLERVRAKVTRAKAF
jgi:hypothetical protein